MKAQIATILKISLSILLTLQAASLCAVDKFGLGADWLAGLGIGQAPEINRPPLGSNQPNAPRPPDDAVGPWFVRLPYLREESSPEPVLNSPEEQLFHTINTSDINEDELSHLRDSGVTTLLLRDNERDARGRRIPLVLTNAQRDLLEHYFPDAAYVLEVLPGGRVKRAPVALIDTKEDLKGQEEELKRFRAKAQEPQVSASGRTFTFNANTLQPINGETLGNLLTEGYNDIVITPQRFARLTAQENQDLLNYFEGHVFTTFTYNTPEDTRLHIDRISVHNMLTESMLAHQLAEEPNAPIIRLGETTKIRSTGANWLMRIGSVEKEITLTSDANLEALKKLAPNARIIVNPYTRNNNYVDLNDQELALLRKYFPEKVYKLIKLLKNEYYIKL